MPFHCYVPPSLSSTTAPNVPARYRPSHSVSIALNHTSPCSSSHASRYELGVTNSLAGHEGSSGGAMWAEEHSNGTGAVWVGAHSNGTGSVWVEAHSNGTGAV